MFITAVVDEATKSRYEGDQDTLWFIVRNFVKQNDKKNG